MMHGFHLPPLFNFKVGGRRKEEAANRTDSEQSIQTVDKKEPSRGSRFRNFFIKKKDAVEEINETVDYDARVKTDEKPDAVAVSTQSTRSIAVRLARSKETSSVSNELEPLRRNRPIDPATAMKHYMKFMSNYEHQEVFLYPNVYFLGTDVQKQQTPFWNDANNFGFDDDESCYILVSHDHLAYRYEILKILGKGSFGQVIKAFDHKENLNVALKVVRNEKRFHKQAQVEVRILDQLRKQDFDNTANVVHMLEQFVFRNHVCITFELLNLNLYEVLKRSHFNGFRIQLVRKFCFSILQCLNFLHRNRLIHCDLKPENILLKQPGRSGIKVIDFGSSCYEHQQMYSYIQSRYYRAPEVILGARYSPAIDMWSLGCIVAELYTGHPLLQGEDEGDQLACIVELRGLPSRKFLKYCKRERRFIDSSGMPRYCTEKATADGRTIVTGGLSRKGRYRGPPNSRTIEEAFAKKGGVELLNDFVLRCLEVNPDERWKPEEALCHPWFRSRPTPVVAEKQSTITDPSSVPRISLQLPEHDRSSHKVVDKGRTVANKVSSSKTVFSTASVSK